MKQKPWEQAPPVEVIWRDAAIDVDHEGHFNDADSIAEFGGRAHMRDIGYLIAETPEEIKLAVSICEDDDAFHCSVTIPRDWVTAIHYLHRSDHRPAHPGPAHGPASRRDRPPRPSHRRRRRPVSRSPRLHS